MAGVVGGLHLSPLSTTPWVSHCPICSQERGRHTDSPSRLTGGRGGGQRGKIDQAREIWTQISFRDLAKPRRFHSEETLNP